MPDNQKIGIGVQVFVEDASPTDRSPWPAEPSGVVIDRGSSVPGAPGLTSAMWRIDFDEPQNNADGNGPFSTALVHERFLHLAPAVDEV